MIQPRIPSAGGPASMRDIELDDHFWREAVDALRHEAGTDTLASSNAAFAETLEDAARQAREDAALIGIRLAGEERNPRLLAFLAAAWLARSGLRAVFVDLSQDLRWLERLTGLDLKQGLVDHVHYGVPLERCVRDTALPGLAVLTGGTRFLTGSPFDDAPAVRGAIDRLKQHFQAVVMTLPSTEPASEAGVLALCDVLLAVTSEEAELEPVGRERLLVRLVGDPGAAEDLAAAAHRFVGPLPELFAGARRAGAGHAVPAWEEPASSPSTTPAVRATGEAHEDLAFLSLFEESPEERTRNAGGFGELEETDFPDVGPPADPEWPARRRRRLLASLGVAAVVVGAMVLGTRFLPDLARSADGGRVAETATEPVDRRPIGLGEEPAAEGALVPLDEAPSPAAPAATPEPMGDQGRPAPYSLHVGSFQSEASALETATRLERAGWTAFVAPVDLDARGLWHRVYAGAFTDQRAAEEALSSLTGRRLVPEGAVRETPLTFLLGVYPTLEEAERRRAELRERGIPAYVAGRDPARVYAGAYATREESRRLEGSLHAAAERVTLTTRIES
ncbi:MAG TPA: SPOR domain-containing protein [Gemmatimonadota bacterium]|nr:SPOR domain-containing protein [Gemmatimonadota bacterium]